jgi:hypothetical protein
VGRSVTRRRLPLTWAVAGVVVACGVGGYFFWSPGPTLDEPPERVAEEVEPRDLVVSEAGLGADFSPPPVGEKPAAEEFFGVATTDLRREEIWRTAVGGSNAEKVGLALEILEAPSSAWTERARQLLVLYLGEDVGDDPAVWRRAVESRQAEQTRQRGRILQKLEQHRVQFDSTE